MSSSESNYSPLFSSIIKQCETTVDKAKTMAKKWFEAELGQDTYENYIRKLKGQLIGTLPKTINQPTDAQHLEKLDEKATLDKLYKDLALVRNAVAERELVASKREGIDNEIFTNLHTEIIQVIEELRNVFDGFQMHPPSEADKEPNSVRHEYSEEETDRKHRNWLIFHDYIVLVEYTHDVMKHLDEKYCSSTA